MTRRQWRAHEKSAARGLQRTPPAEGGAWLLGGEAWGHYCSPRYYTLLGGHVSKCAACGCGQPERPSRKEETL